MYYVVSTVTAEIIKTISNITGAHYDHKQEVLYRPLTVSEQRTLGPSADTCVSRLYSFRWSLTNAEPYYTRLRLFELRLMRP